MPHMADVELVHTADLTSRERTAVRTLLDHAFDGDFSDDDFEHTLGGLHAMVRDRSAVVAHGSVVLRRLAHGGRALRTGYVEGVAVHPDRRGQGLGAGVMVALERVILAAYELGALSATAEASAWYARRGWVQWTGTTSVVTPDGTRRTEEDDGGVYMKPVTAVLDHHGDLACDWRKGDVW